MLAAAVMLRGALRRGRDSFYPALGAGCLVALLIRGFADASIFAQAVSIIAAATVGLALAQSSGLNQPDGSACDHGRHYTEQISTRCPLVCYSRSKFCGLDPSDI